MPKSFYLMQRNNPQITKPSYTAKGQLTKKEARDAEGAIYGSYTAFEYKTEAEYHDAILKLEADGFKIHNRPEIKKEQDAKQ